MSEAISQQTEQKRFHIKQALAKLMATENILVEHAAIKTAAFDVVNRKLYLPLWQDISEDVYSLLISHEIGHALYTPTEEWVKQIMKSKSQEDLNLKNVVNVVEDVRIEKMVQKKYPGSINSFRRGYNELMEKDFFGIRKSGKKIEEYGILDRINLHFKMKMTGTTKVPFKDEELIWLRKVEACKTFEEVLSVSKELLAYAERQPEYQPMEMDNREITIQADSLETAEALKKLLSSENGEENSNAPGQIVNIEYPTNCDQLSESGNVDKHTSIKVKSLMQQAFDNALEEQVDIHTKTVTLTIPKFQLNKIIVDYKQILNDLEGFYGRKVLVSAQAREALANFRSNNFDIVNQLVNLFEMKKKAKLSQRSRTSKTGVLDSNKLHTYRYNEDIFKKITDIPAGKNHALIILLDLSGSMTPNMAGCYAQMIVIAMFCRKVNIPFEVYGFSDVGNYSNYSETIPSNEVYIDNLQLRNYLSSRMSLLEHNKMLEYLMCLMSQYPGGNSGQVIGAGIPYYERLGGTPLIQTLLVAPQIVLEMKKTRGVDIINTVIITDGDATDGISYNNRSSSDRYTKEWVGNTFRCSDLFLRHYTTNTLFYVKRPKDRNDCVANTLTNYLITLYKDVSSTKLIGFYICEKRSAEYVLSKFYPKKSLDVDKKLEQFQNDNFTEISHSLYDSYYIVRSGKTLLPSEERLDLGEHSSTRSTIHKRFLRAMQKKKVSRIFLNKFIDHIA